jgi:hypothetical protein
MAGRQDAPPAPRSRSAPRVVAPKTKTNVALPFARFTVQESAMTAGDWISLAGLVISVIGFSVVIWQSARTANAPEAGN